MKTGSLVVKPWIVSGRQGFDSPPVGLFGTTNPNETLPVLLELQYRHDEILRAALERRERRLHSGDVGTPRPSWITRDSE